MKWIFNWSLRQAKQRAEEVYQEIHHRRLYREDLLPASAVEGLRAMEERWKQIQNSRKSEDFEDYRTDGEMLYVRIFPADSMDWIRENVESFLVAIVVALAIRAYFLQPFKIPTDSMKPTLFGIHAEARIEANPALPKRIVDFALFGTTYHRLVAEKESTLERISPHRFTPWFEYADFYFSSGQVDRIWISTEAIRKIGVSVGQKFHAGETVFNTEVDTGDHVLVNKMSYHFRLPKRGEVFVFLTTGIDGIERDFPRRGIQGSQYYIKRCVGVAGDELQIQEPHLRVNGKPFADNSMVLKVQEAKNGYRGYTSNIYGANFLRTPDDLYELGQDRYWAMGDNSYNSLDSRVWGAVPRPNLVGTGLFVYWPFGARWGLIR